MARLHNGLVDLGYGRFRVDHSNDEFGKGAVHINGIEGFWEAGQGPAGNVQGPPLQTHLPPPPHGNRTAIQPSPRPQVQDRSNSNPRVHAQGLTPVNDVEAAPGLFGRLYRPFHNEFDDLANRSTVNAGRSTGPLAAVGPVQRWLERDNDIGAALRERIADVNRRQ